MRAAYEHLSVHEMATEVIGKFSAGFTLDEEERSLFTQTLGQSEKLSCFAAFFSCMRPEDYLAVRSTFLDTAGQHLGCGMASQFVREQAACWLLTRHASAPLCKERMGNHFGLPLQIVCSAAHDVLEMHRGGKASSHVDYDLTAIRLVLLHIFVEVVWRAWRAWALDLVRSIATPSLVTSRSKNSRSRSPPKGHVDFDGGVGDSTHAHANDEYEAMKHRLETWHQQKTGVSHAQIRSAEPSPHGRQRILLKGKEALRHVIKEIRARGFGDASGFYAFCDRNGRQFVSLKELQRALKDLEIAFVDARSIMLLSTKMQTRNGMEHEPQLGDLDFVRLFSWEDYFRSDATGVYLGHLPAYVALSEARRQRGEIIKCMLKSVQVMGVEGAQGAAVSRFYQRQPRPRRGGGRDISAAETRRRPGYARPFSHVSNSQREDVSDTWIRRDLKSSLTASISGANWSCANTDLVAVGAGMHVYSPTRARWFGPNGAYSTIYTTKYSSAPKNCMALSLNIAGGRGCRASSPRAARAANPRSRPDSARAHSDVSTEEAAREAFLRPTSPLHVPRNYRFHPSATPNAAARSPVSPLASPRCLSRCSPSAARHRARSALHMMEQSQASPCETRDENNQPVGQVQSDNMGRKDHSPASSSSVVSPCTTALRSTDPTAAATPMSWIIDDTSALVDADQSLSQRSLIATSREGNEASNRPQATSISSPFTELLTPGGLCRFCGQGHIMVEPMLLQQAVARERKEEEDVVECCDDVGIHQYLASEGDVVGNTAGGANEAATGHPSRGLGLLPSDFGPRAEHDGALMDASPQTSDLSSQKRPHSSDVLEPHNFSAQQNRRQRSVNADDVDRHQHRSALHVIAQLQPALAGHTHTHTPYISALHVIAQLQPALAGQTHTHTRSESLDCEGSARTNPETEVETHSNGMPAPGLSKEVKRGIAMDGNADSDALGGGLKVMREDGTVRDMLLTILSKDFGRRMLWTKGREQVPRELLKTIREDIQAVRKAAKRAVYDPHFKPDVVLRPASARSPSTRPLPGQAVARRPASVRNKDAARPHSARPNGVSDSWWNSASSLSSGIYYTESRIRGSGERFSTPLLYGQPYETGGTAWSEQAAQIRASDKEAAGSEGDASGQDGRSADGSGQRQEQRRVGVEIPKLIKPLPPPGSGCHYYSSIPGEVNKPVTESSTRLERGRVQGRSMLGYDRGLLAQKDVIREYARCW